MKASNSIGTVAVLAGLFLLVTTPAAKAQEDDWEFTANLYGWYASIGGESATGTNIDVDASDVIDALDFAFMGAFEARKGKWLFMTDLVYLDLGDAGSRDNLDLEAWVVTPVVGYNLLETEATRLDVIGGARYLWLEAELDLARIGGPILSDSDSVWDGIVGVKGEVTLAEKWSLPFYLDIGAGDTDLTWQAAGGLAYKFKRLDAFVGYRHLDWDFDDSKVFNDLNFSGPYAGIKVRF